MRKLTNLEFRASDILFELKTSNVENLVCNIYSVMHGEKSCLEDCDACMREVLRWLQEEPNLAKAEKKKRLEEEINRCIKDENMSIGGMFLLCTEDEEDVFSDDIYQRDEALEMILNTALDRTKTKMSSALADIENNPDALYFFCGMHQSKYRCRPIKTKKQLGEIFLTGRLSASEEEDEHWIIGICDSAETGIFLHHYFGTEEEVREKMMEAVLTDRLGNEDQWSFGPKRTCDIKDYIGSWDCLYASAGFYEDEGIREIQYVAYRISDIAEI